MKAVFDVRPTLKYDSDLCRAFNFQGRANYLKVAEACVGDWVVFRETKAGGGEGAYIAVAFVTAMHAHPGMHGFYSLTLRDYLMFNESVPMRRKGRYAETRLIETPRLSQIGSVLQGQAMRPLYDADFHLIVRAGFGLSGDLAPLAEDEFLIEPESADWKSAPVRLVLQSRLFRDEVIRRQVGFAYDFRCAVTRTRNTNGNGRYEAQCAHVWSLADLGPDIVQNCIALAGTAHWLFDNYAFTIEPDFTLKLASGLIDPAYIGLLPAKGERIHLPHDERLWPHAKFLDHHRSEFHRRRG